MRIEMYGLVFETPGITVFLSSPWRCLAIEHRLFEAVKGIPDTQFEAEPDEYRVHLNHPNSWYTVLNAVTRVLKGWQEEASDVGNETRSWRWLLEADTDDHGYDHNGDRTCIWGGIELSWERGSPGDLEKEEELDLEGFGVRIWNNEEGKEN
jgi:hypothetical protein